IFKAMTTPSVTALFATIAFIPIVLSAQNAPIQSGIGNDDTGAPKLSLQEPLPGEKMIDRLKLDDKTQAPEVRLLLMDASRDATPVAQQLLDIRLRLGNVAIQNR